MPFFQYEHIKISAVASAVPAQTVRADDFKEVFGKEQVDKFKDMVGVREYRKTREHQTASDLGFAAAEKIIQEKKIDREEIGALVFASHAPDYRRPATACVLHKRLGLSKECAAFDIGLGCSAFVYGVQVICSLLQNSDIEKALLIVGETMTKTVNPKDKATAMLFGDGGSAVLFEKTEEKSSINILLRTDGTGYKSIIIPAGGFRNLSPDKDAMIWKDGNSRTLYNAYMNGTDVFSFTISDIPRTIKDFFEKTGTCVENYDCFAMHQANKYIHKQLAKKLKIPMEKMPLSLDRYGNTSAPAVPLTMCDAYGRNMENREMNVLMSGFGVGLSWGVVSAKVNVMDIYEILETDDYFEEGVINCPSDLEK